VPALSRQLPPAANPTPSLTPQPAPLRRRRLQFQVVGRPLPASTGFTSPRAPSWSADDVTFDRREAFRDFSFSHFHATVFAQVDAPSPLPRSAQLWISPYPRLPSCNLFWVRNTINYWLDGSTPAVPATKVAPTIFCVEVARHSRVPLRFFPQPGNGSFLPSNFEFGFSRLRAPLRFVF
jgi:hypothetical protein